MANLYSRRGLFKRYRKEDYEKLSTVLEKWNVGIRKPTDR